MKTKLIIFIIVLLLFIFCYINITKFKNNNIYTLSKTTNNTKISALSYKYINSKVPEHELLYFFMKNYNDIKYVNYINKFNINKIFQPPVYCIKKINDKYEYEIYLYKYNPYRPSFLKLDINYNTFLSNKDYNYLNIYPKKINDSLLENFIILSYDINEHFFKNNKISYNYYLNNNDKKFCYCTYEEDYLGNVNKTNIYGLFYHIFNYNDRKQFLIELFETNETIIFYAYKSKTNCHCIYFENLCFKKFLLFLKFFKYDTKIINFCINKYDNTYKFCVSYDLNSEFMITKTTIFSILNF
jgi:hypothetical protein